jgi:hypothetical protein
VCAWGGARARGRAGVRGGGGGGGCVGMNDMSGCSAKQPLVFINKQPVQT